MKSRVASGDAETGRGVALRVEVDHQHPVAERRQRGAEVDRGRGLADAALLVGDGKDMGFGPGCQTRSIAPISTMAAFWLGQAGMDLVVEPPVRRGVGDLLMHRRALGKQANTPGRAMFFGIAEQDRSSGASARAETTSARCGGRLSIRAVEHRDRAGRPPGRRVAQEGGLALVALHQANLELGRLLGREGGDHQAGEAGAGAEVEPEPGARRPQAPELGRVGEVPVPGRRRGSTGETRLIRGFHLSQQRAGASRSRAIVSRETSKAARNASGAGDPARSRRRAAPARRARSRISVSAAGVMPSIRAAWPRLSGRTPCELVAQLGREPRRSPA